ncbi:hypothetical protein LZ30DRAFT_57383 [Colletotrichum cereale]|nr:hypothetical protein LZ30DRAFT_57383 [Colletotrichum cereale]
MAKNMVVHRRFTSRETGTRLSWGGDFIQKKKRCHQDRTKEALGLRDSSQPSSPVVTPPPISSDPRALPAARVCCHDGRTDACAYAHAQHVPMRPSPLGRYYYSRRASPDRTTTWSPAAGGLRLSAAPEISDGNGLVLQTSSHRGFRRLSSQRYALRVFQTKVRCTVQLVVPPAI